MLNPDKFPCKSSLISSEIEAQLSEVFQKLTEDITLVSVIDAHNEKCTELATFINHMASLSPRINCNFHDLDEYKKTDAALSCILLPVVGIFKGNEYSRVAFHGIPGGKEINSFVMAILNAGGCAKPFSPEYMEKLQKCTTQTQMKIYVSLQCHHCAKVVIECQRMALLNENIQSAMVDANLYPDLVSKYNIERVPMLIVNDKHVLMGEQTAEQIIDSLNSRC